MPPRPRWRPTKSSVGVWNCSRLGYRSASKLRWLAGHHALHVLQDAQAAGYEITLVFVATSDPTINVRRVAERQARGGHGIAEVDIIRRYRRSLDNLEAAMRCADHVRLIDNSVHNVPHEYARFDSGFVAVEDPVPEFGRAAVVHLIERAEQA